MTTLERQCRSLAATYNRLNAQAVAAANAFTELQENKDYSDSYKRDRLNQLAADRDRITRDNMDAMQAAVDKAVEEIRSEHKIDLSNNAAHQIAVSNALKMVELAGSNMTPQQLQGLANTFIEANDRQTLDLLQTICLDRCPDAFHTAFGAGIEDDVSRVERFGLRLVRGIGVSERASISIGLAQQYLNIIGQGDIVLEG